jgi:hypothetical protein
MINESFSCKRQKITKLNGKKSGRLLILDANQEASASSWRRATVHGSRRTIHGEKRQLMTPAG